MQDACTYATRFLAWWGICLYLLQLGSRRQLDYELRDGGPQVLTNLNRLAETQQTTLPVHDTLDHFVGHVKLAGWEFLPNTDLIEAICENERDFSHMIGK